MCLDPGLPVELGVLLGLGELPVEQEPRIASPRKLTSRRILEEGADVVSVLIEGRQDSELLVGDCHLNAGGSMGSEVSGHQEIVVVRHDCVDPTEALGRDLSGLQGLVHHLDHGTGPKLVALRVVMRDGCVDVSLEDLRVDVRVRRLHLCGTRRLAQRLDLKANQTEKS